VTLIGRIELFKGRSEIVITSPNQIEKCAPDQNPPKSTKKNGEKCARKATLSC
jgi:hypothetical protein